jgi:hypothetical protein
MARLRAGRSTRAAAPAAVETLVSPNRTAPTASRKQELSRMTVAAATAIKVMRPRAPAGFGSEGGIESYMVSILAQMQPEHGD